MDTDSLKILLVEDNPGDARLLREILAEGGKTDFELVHVETLAQAWEALAAGGTDLILLDLSVPGSQGVDTFIRVFERHPDVPVVVLTGLQDEELALQLVQMGAQDYLVKGEINGALLVRSLRYAIERFRLQEELAEKVRQVKASEERFRQLADATFEGIAISKNGIILDVNEQFARIFGYAGEEVVGRPALDFVAPESQDLVRRNIEEGYDRPYEHVGLKKDGSRLFLAVQGVTREDGKHRKRVTVLRDITERKLRERRVSALRQVREAVQEMQDPTDIQQVLVTVREGLVAMEIPFQDWGINIVDPSSDPPRVTFYNMSSAGPLKTGEQEERMGDLIVAFWSKGEPVFRRDLEAEDRYREREHVGSKYGHSVRSVLDIPFSHGTLAVNSAVPEAFSGGDIAFLQTLAGVLSEGYTRLDDLQALETKEQQLQQAQKMEAIGRLAGGIAHDFNNLLTIIKGYSHILLKSLDDQDSERGSLEEIHQAALRAESLVRQLLIFSRRQPIQPETLDLNAVVDEAEKMLGRLIGERIELVLDKDLELGKVIADRGQVEQVIMNLVINARDAMPEGGRIAIETRNVELDQAYTDRRAEMQPGSYVMLAVTDTGIGMGEETQSHIFEPFFTTKGVDKGTGLGLATVYGIVTQNGGHIEVRSAPGEGSSFRVYLPRVGKVAEGRKEESFSSPVAARDGETVLVVEDDEIVRRVVCETLSECGYTVLEAGHGREALEVFARGEEGIHLVLTDVVMPEMDGFELANWLAERHPETKVLFMSGYYEQTAAGWESPGEEIEIIWKPFVLNELVSKVREMLDARVQTAESQVHSDATEREDEVGTAG